MQGKTLLRNAVAVLAIGIMLAVAAPARGDSTNTCLKVVNNRSRTTSVTVRGYDEKNSWWSFAPGESAYLTMDGSPIRSASFTIYLYDGDGINNSQSLTGDNKFVDWKLDPESQDHGRCQDGSEVVTLHD